MNIYLKLFLVLVIISAIISIPIEVNNQINNNKKKRLELIKNEYNMLKSNLDDYLQNNRTYEFKTYNIDQNNNILLLSNDDLQEYSSKNYLDFVQINDKQYNIFEILLHMIEQHKYEYVIYIDKNIINNDTRQDIKEFIYKSGDNDLILFSNLETNEINMNCIIYRNCEFSKLHIFNIIKNSSKLTYNIFTNQLHTEYIQNIKNKHPYIPNILSGIILYNEDILSKMKENKFVYPFSKIVDNRFTEISCDSLSYIEKLEDNNKIPKNIFQIMETNITLKSQYKHVIQRVQNMNPEYKYYFVNGYEGKKFIKENFNDRIQFAYDKLLPGAFKSDLLRYCLLYTYGGVYIDFNVYMLEKFDNIIKNKYDFISARDSRKNNSLWQGFLISKPKHPILKLCIDMCCDNIINEKYKDFKNNIDRLQAEHRNVLNISGPELIGDSIDILNNNTQLIVGENTIADSKIKIFEFINSIPYIKDKNTDTKIACSKYFFDNVLQTLYPNIKEDNKTFYKILGGKERYADAFHNKRVYKFNKLK